MRRFTLEEQAAHIARRVAEGVRVPPVALLRNGGARRTDSKRRLLETLRRVAEQQGRPPPFPQE